MRGKFIVFEGIDGSGSSTQATALHTHLLTQGYKAVLTAEPSPGPIGNMIREIQTRRITLTADRAIREKILSQLFAADRADHLYNDINGIERQLESGGCVISARYVLSSLAYHVFSPEDYESISVLNAQFPQPDITLYLDCSVEHSLSRINLGRVPDLNEEKSNLLRVYQNYQTALSRYHGCTAVVNAMDAAQTVSEKVIAALTRHGII